jgi:hypothetical protein
MTYTEVTENLCSFDKRNPMYEFMFSMWDEDEKPKAKDDCNCDNCFYGRNVLALELLNYMEK